MKVSVILWKLEMGQSANRVLHLESGGKGETAAQQVLDYLQRRCCVTGIRYVLYGNQINISVPASQLSSTVQQHLREIILEALNIAI